MESTFDEREATRQAVHDVSKRWWLWLVFGIVWINVGLIILQFDEASINTVGIIIGLMFLSSGIQQFAIALLAERGRWLYVVFGVLFTAGGIVSLISPENTFAALADVLGFIFLTVGAFWVIIAFASREVNELWWVNLIAGIMMIILAFWTAGQFFIEKGYVLLVFAGIWALMHGVTDLVRAFQIRKLRELV
jgi:uncharacterized membrane protein HdeD (DUF308 family)